MFIRDGRRASTYTPPRTRKAMPEGPPMFCSRCNADTPNGAKFCMECGTPLRARCPQCGADALPQAKFWGASDSPFGGAPAAPPPAHAQPPVSFTPGHLVDGRNIPHLQGCPRRRAQAGDDGPIADPATHMEQRALPGSIFVTPEELRLGEGHIQVNALGPVPIKGLHAPVEIFGDRTEEVWVRTRRSIQAPIWG